MTPKILKIAGPAWLIIPPILLSAIVHMADPDIDGWQGLAPSSVLVSVFLFGLLIAGCVLCCLVVLVGFGRLAFLLVSGVFAAVAGFLLAVFGSGATTPMGVMWTFVGSSGLVFVVVLLAVVPAAVLGWPLSRRSKLGNGG